MLNETEPLLVAKFEQILITDFCSKGFLFKHLRWAVNYFRGKLHHKYFTVLNTPLHSGLGTIRFVRELNFPKN